MKMKAVLKSLLIAYGITGVFLLFLALALFSFDLSEKAVRAGILAAYILACLTGGYGWNSGYGAVSLVQIVLAAVLFISLPLWKRKDMEKAQEEAPAKALGLVQALKIRGVPLVLVAFFSYCALESTAGLWASSYLVQYRGINADVAAGFASLFFLE